MRQRIGSPMELEIASFPIETDILATTIESNFNCSAKQRAAYTLHNDNENADSPIVLQPDVYYHAKVLAGDLGLGRVVDIGCGNGQKLRHYFGEGGLDVHGIDLPSFLPEAPWSGLRLHACNLSLYDSIDGCFQEFADSAPTLFIMAGVLQRLPDPRPALRVLRSRLRMSSSNRLVLSTPDRSRTSGDTIDMPQDESHVREWSLEELVSFVGSCGFTVNRQAFTRSDNQDTERRTCYVECSCSDESYATFLSEHHMPPASEMLIITTEHADAGPTGGIGSYVKCLETLLEDVKPLTLLIGADVERDKELMEQKRWLYPEKLLKRTDHKDRGDLVLDTVKHIVFFYDDLRVIECQDYLGDCYRVAQAKQSGLIPTDLLIRVTCHGSVLQLENIGENWASMDFLPTAHKERELVELADIVSFPSNYLKELYKDRGYRIAPSRSDVCGQPMLFDDEFAGEEFSPIDTLIFMGTRNRGKGYEDFVEVLAAARQESGKTNAWAKVRRIILLGRKTNECAAADALAQTMVDRFEMVELRLKHDETMRFLESQRSHSIVLAPYRGDNYPYTVGECINVCCPLVTYRAGGTPEMIPAMCHAQVFSEPNSSSLKEAVDRILMAPAAERRSRAIELKKATAHAHAIVNAGLKSLFHGYMRQHDTSKEQPGERSELPGEENRFNRSKQPLQERVVNLESDMVTVIVTVHNTLLEYIGDLCKGLNNQTLKPKEVVFVDDGSREGYAESLQSFIHQKLRLPHRVIAQENRGLPAARNRGLQEVSSKYVLTHDSDDICKPDLIWMTVNFLERNPGYVSASTYVSELHAGESYESFRAASDFMPLGSFLIMGLFENIFGVSTACFRTERLTALGGWDETDKSMYEDWALYLRLTGLGYSLGVVNSQQFLYRIRPDSMVRTYPLFPALCRLARNIVGLDRFEAFSLMRLVHDHQRLQAEKLQSLEYIRRLSDQMASLTYRIASRSTAFLNKIPAVKSAIKAILLFTWGIVKWFGKKRDSS